MNAPYPNEIGARPPRITIDTDEEPSPARAEQHSRDATVTLTVLELVAGLTIASVIGGAVAQVVLG